MYIKKVEIENIRSISKFSMEFEKPAGWHVIIGDNGSGKSNVVKSIALGLIGKTQSGGLRQNWEKWLKQNEKLGRIFLQIEVPEKLKFDKNSIPATYYNHIKLAIQREQQLVALNDESMIQIPATDLRGFCCGFGPFRRFSGGNETWQEMFENKSFDRCASFLTLFDESVALTQIENWIKDLDYEKLKADNNKNDKYENSHLILKNLKDFINLSKLLPNDSKVWALDGSIEIMDSKGFIQGIADLSDGFRSILSLTFELIRQALFHHSPINLFGSLNSSSPHIAIPGVVLIDEIDAHLHPTWQTRIGQWFTKYFPNIQFIVTTHSPLICRAAENGTIWRLSAPGSNEISGEVTGIERERLIYGNVLDAYGTEVFGKSVSISKTSSEKLQRLGELNIKSLLGDKLTKKEIIEFQDLKSVFPTENLETQR